MEERLHSLETEALKLIESCNGIKVLEEIRVKYLGRKGELNRIFNEMTSVTDVETRKAVGRQANEIKNRLEELISRRRSQLSETEIKEAVDVTLPGRRTWTGHYHPLTIINNEICNIFLELGFSIELGPEVETDWYNFEALNIPAHHPSRDMVGSLFSSFFIEDDVLLRSHTSPVQIRVMEKRKPPIKSIMPGRVYRYDRFDASHSPVFHQLEALYINKGVGFGELKWILDEFCRRFYGRDVKLRFLPSYFPFTEPSAEVSVSCVICQGKGCKVCKGSGWIEIFGAGMVHPKVLLNCKINPKIYSGYAFGLGVDRAAMIKYFIDDLRLLFENDIRFLEQF